MGKALAILPDPPRVLVLSGTAAAGAASADESRRAVLAALVPTGCDIVFASGRREASPSAAGERLPPLADFGALVVDRWVPGAGDSAFVEQMRARVEAGACVLVISGSPEATAEAPTAWWELIGARPAAAHPMTEWFAKTGCATDDLARRLPEEFGVVDEMVSLAAAPETTPILTVSVAYVDRPVVTARRLGRGRVVVSGLGRSDDAGRHPELRVLSRRALVPPEALAETQREIGLGVLGYGPYGGMGLYHGMAARATAGIEFVAACDSDAARRKAAEAEFPGLRAYDSTHDLIADDEVELVVVATPPSSHFTLALELIEAGKHVALEKPMCLTLLEADRLIEAADRAGVVLTVHQSRRWDADFLTIKRCVESGLLGEVFSAETFVGGYEHPCRAWHSEVSISGGAVYDWGSHHLDWILQLMDGYPSQLTAHGHKRVWHDVTNLDQLRVRLVWVDGREAEFLQSDIAAIRRPKFYVQGTSGTLVGRYRPVSFERIEPGLGLVSEVAHHAEAPAELSCARYEAAAGLSEAVLPLVAVPRFAFHRNLADHIQFGEPLAVRPESVRRVVALLEAAQKSTDEGNVTVPLPAL